RYKILDLWRRLGAFLLSGYLVFCQKSKGGFVLNQERKRKFVFKQGRKGRFVLNQERKDARIDRILLIFSSFLFWFKTPFQMTLYTILIILKSFLSWFKTTHKT